MTFNYKTGLFRVWLVLSLLWLIVGLFAGADAGTLITVSLVFGIVLCLIVWAIRGFTVKVRPPADTFDLQEFRQDLAAKVDPEIQKRELDPLLDRLQAEYGNHVPLSELVALGNLCKTNMGQLEEQMQGIINQGARDGETIDLDPIRETLEKSKATYDGPDRDAYGPAVDRLLQSLSTRYGNQIPVDDAYRIMRRMEAGQGLPDDCR